MASQHKVFSGAKVLVTGHCGFKGGWLSTWLASVGAEVHGLSLEVPTEPSLFEAARLKEIVSDVRLNVSDHAGTFACIDRVKPDFVFHLAAQPLVKLSYDRTIDTWASNLMGTVSVLEALRRCDRNCVAIFITSDKCYDNVEWVWGYRETDTLGGPDPYSASKGAAELAIKSYVKSFFAADGPVRIGIGRAGNVIGGGDWAADRIVPDCMRAWRDGRVVALRNPQATRPWQHVLEPLSGYMNLAFALHESNRLHGEPFNFGPNLDLNYTVADIVASMTAAWPGAKWQDVSEGSPGQNESNLLKLNCDKALAFLQWRPAMDLAETLNMTVSWYKTFYQDPSRDMRQMTLDQIATYATLAGERNIAWAQ